MRYKMTLAYDGSDFRGWQIQPDAPSVQGTIEKALGVLLKYETGITGAGRTDTGVHAAFYVAHFDSDIQFDSNELCRKMNAILPFSITIFCIEPVNPDFHARFDARKREYKYFIHRSKNPFAIKYSYLCAYPDLDFKEMNRAASFLIGAHDFSSFEKTGADNKTSDCTVFEAVWEPCEGPVSAGINEGRAYWCFRISADRFLRNMVRAIVGTLIEVGRGKRSADSMTALLERKDRCSAGESVPGNALFLTGIEY